MVSQKTLNLPIGGSIPSSATSSTSFFEYQFETFYALAMKHLWKWLRRTRGKDFYFLVSPEFMSGWIESTKNQEGLWRKSGDNTLPGRLKFRDICINVSHSLVGFEMVMVHRSLGPVFAVDSKGLIKYRVLPVGREKDALYST